MVVDNLGLLWVAIEATTLVSALLVGFYRTRSALEAAWKYLILCTVGITFALFGLLLIYYAADHVLGDAGAALNWTDAAGRARHARSRPDAAGVRLRRWSASGPRPGSRRCTPGCRTRTARRPRRSAAVLSGVLLNCALYGILRCCPS